MRRVLHRPRYAVRAVPRLLTALADGSGLGRTSAATRTQSALQHVDAIKPTVHGCSRAVGGDYVICL